MPFYLDELMDRKGGEQRERGEREWRLQYERETETEALIYETMAHQKLGTCSIPCGTHLNVSGVEH